MQLSQGARFASWALLATGLINFAFYAVLIAIDYPLEPGHPEAVRALSQAQTWSDSYMGAAAIAGGAGLRLGWKWARVLGIVAAAALVHMGITDIAMFAQHDLYASPSTGIKIMIVVDSWAVLMGSMLVWILGNQLEPIAETEREPAASR
ncbi:MAG: hypothetical protein GY723_00390 [bacterium]|nr:hypothetical protein [bacterium]MCP5065585.1 hypothetical protein [bacterium]